METTIKIENNSKKILEEFDDAILRALERIGSQAEGYAKDLAPYDTGFLRNSITHAIGGESAAQGQYSADNAGSDGVKRSGSYSGTAEKDESPSVLIGSNVEYAAAQETGSSRSAAHPYIVPAVKNHASTYRAIIKDELESG